jgi:iron complex outermembrane receptor protein
LNKSRTENPNRWSAAVARTGWPLLLGAALGAPLTAFAVEDEAAIPDNLTELSFEQLGDIQITSVSKKPERLIDAAAAVFVITNEDIRRSGATKLPQVLRLAPNLQVAQMDASNFAISARGFNNTLSNKLLVLIDGRTVYSPLFSGVFWDAQDMVLEDVERIEVISGPGATLWGANAVNGVINIITRSAADTRGGLLSVGASTRKTNGVVRYGGTLANGGYYRVYGKHTNNDQTRRADGTPIMDAWHRIQTGFRTDWGDRDDGLTLQGDVYRGRQEAGDSSIRINGGNLLGRITRQLAGGSNIRLQSYLEHAERNRPDRYADRLDTVDLDLQHTVPMGTMHTVVWGTGYRLSLDRMTGTPALSFVPDTRVMHWGNLFAQDEIALRENLRLTAGLRMEHNNYTGAEFLPSLSLAWKPEPEHLVWGSASRSVRVPSRVDRDVYTACAGAPTCTTYGVAGGANFVSEIQEAYQIGYRVQPTPYISYSINAFYSRYDKLRTLSPVAGGDPVFSNNADGASRGLELSGSWEVTRSWRLTGGLVTQTVQTQPYPGSADLSRSSSIAGNDPSAYWSLRSSFNISETKELDASLRRVGKLSNPEVPSYTAMDVRFGWKVRRNLELSVTALNLLNPSHAEFGAAPNRSVYDRSVFINLLWHF